MTERMGHSLSSLSLSLSPASQGTHEGGLWRPLTNSECRHQLTLHLIPHAFGRSGKEKARDKRDGEGTGSRSLSLSLRSCVIPALPVTQRRGREGSPTGRSCLSLSSSLSLLYVLLSPLFSLIHPPVSSWNRMPGKRTKREVACGRERRKVG